MKVNNPICPYCGHRIPKEMWKYWGWENDWVYDGNTIEETCKKCKKTFINEVHVQIKFSIVEDK